jgi:hypothetical protein
MHPAVVIALLQWNCAWFIQHYPYLVGPSGHLYKRDFLSNFVVWGVILFTTLQQAIKRRRQIKTEGKRKNKGNS